MLKSDAVPRVLIAIDAADPIIKSPDFVGLVQYANLIEFATLCGCGQCDQDATTKTLLAQKADPNTNPDLDQRLIGCHLIKLFDDCLVEFIHRVMGNPLMAYSLTSLGAGCPYPAMEAEPIADGQCEMMPLGEYPPAFTEFCVMFKLATVGPINDPTLQVIVRGGEGDFQDFETDDPHSELAAEVTPPKRLH